MKVMRGVCAILPAILAACGSDNDATVDAPPTPDARQCGSLTSATVDFTNEGDDFLLWSGDLPGVLGDGLRLSYQFEFYGGIEPSLAGTFDLHTGNQTNYKTCAVCVRAFAFNANDEVVKVYFQSRGTVTLAEDPFVNRHMIASFTDLELEEVDIAGDYTSSAVTGGACASLASFNIDRDRVPNAWTCSHDAWDSGASCDCTCGLNDPDCLIANAPVAGCATAGQACFNDACVTPPANDTCASATPLTIGTPVTGTTIGGARNYNAGLEGTGCTGFAQPGPDVVYSVALAQDQAITVTLSNPAANFDGAIALVGPEVASCDASPITTCVAGADKTFDGEGETFTYTATTAGTYYVVVDAFAPNEGGTFTLGVTSP